MDLSFFLCDARVFTYVSCEVLKNKIMMELETCTKAYCTVLKKKSEDGIIKKKGFTKDVLLIQPLFVV